MLATLAHTFLTLPGQAGEDLGIERHLKTNTSPRRQHSLFKQGLMWYDLIPTMKVDRLRALMKRFDQLLAEHAMMSNLFGVL